MDGKCRRSSGVVETTSETADETADETAGEMAGDTASEMASDTAGATDRTRRCRRRPNGVEDCGPDNKPIL